MTFMVFIFLAIHIKTRELRYCRHGKTHEEYQAFLKEQQESLIRMGTSVIHINFFLMDFRPVFEDQFVGDNLQAAEDGLPYHRIGQGADAYQHVVAFCLP